MALFLVAIRNDHSTFQQKTYWRSLRKTMWNKLLPLGDKLLLCKRALIETINDQLKNISQIEHTRHRSVINCMVNLLAGLVAYTHQPKKKNRPLTCLKIGLSC